jgi:hypothetical protein
LRYSWPECKTAEIKEALAVSDKNTYVLDQYWLYFIHFLCDLEIPNMLDRNEYWVFPILHSKEEANKSAASNVITSTITRLMPTPENINSGKLVCYELYTDNCSSRSLRRGATKEMALQDCQIQDMACKTGHFFPHVSSIWEYFECNEVSLLRSTRALSGFRPSDEVRITNLVSSLMNGVYNLTNHQNMIPILDVWLATFLMYLPEFCKDCSNEYGIDPSDHFIIKVFKEKSKDIISFDCALQFGKEIKEKFNLKNLTSFDSDHSKFQIETIKGMNDLQVQNQSLLCKIDALEKKVESLRETSTKLYTTISMQAEFIQVGFHAV